LEQINASVIVTHPGDGNIKVYLGPWSYLAKILHTRTKQTCSLRPEDANAVESRQQDIGINKTL
jgi:hypothetical protein